MCYPLRDAGKTIDQEGGIYMERQVPKNVRQIGNVSDSPKIYVEDYVYIYGAIQMHDLKMSGNEYVIDESTWKHAYEDCKQYFEDGEMLGWFVAHPGVPLTPDSSTIKLHKKSFPKKNTVFIMKDPVEKDETYFVHKMNDLMEIGGHYTYYEKNPCMQNYMIASRKKNGAVSPETVEDRAAQDFRDLVRKRGDRQKRRKTGGLMYAASACLVLVLIIMGVSMVNSFDRMKSVQSKLDALADTSGTVETRETSGSVTAVTSEEQTGDGQTEEDQSADAQETDGQSGQAGEEQSSNDQTSEAAGADSADAQGTEDQTGQAESDQISAGSGENGSNGVYVVEEGDTLAIISRKMYGDVNHVDAICRMNGITDGNLIYVGQKLLLP